MQACQYQFTFGPILEGLVFLPGLESGWFKQETDNTTTSPPSGLHGSFANTFKPKTDLFFF